MTRDKVSVTVFHFMASIFTVVLQWQFAVGQHCWKPMIELNPEYFMIDDNIDKVFFSSTARDDVFSDVVGNRKMKFA